MPTDDVNPTGHGEKRSRREEAAILALLAQPTLETAAREAKVSAATLYRWLKDPAFQARYRAARREALSQAIGRLQAESGSVAEALLSIATDPEQPASARVSAAVKVLEMGVKNIELEELEARIAALERMASVPTGQETNE
jgi:hypothetical protein